MHGFIITGVFLGDLCPKALGLIFCVIELAETICQLTSPDKELESIGYIGIIVVPAVLAETPQSDTP
jgi:hypothetical protein